MEIKYNLEKIKNLIPSHVQLSAVSKTKPEIDILEAYNSGQRVFGENKAQEMAGKYQNLPKDIQWHFIGHLQTNKIKYISPFVTLIHSVDSAKLLLSIDKEAKRNNRIIDCLLQFYIATEESKFGFDLEEAKALLNSDTYKYMNNIRIAGVMGMATYTENEQLIRNEFKQLAEIFRELKNNYFNNTNSFKEISMGMSGDYQIAIEEGSSMLRIGSSIFGDRNYKI
jgi:pyridoxal phosphate enzyme (YggS family)